MAMEAEKQSIEHIQKLRQYLPESTNEELEQIFAYWEKMKAEWEKREKEFWRKYHSEIWPQC